MQPLNPIGEAGRDVLGAFVLHDVVPHQKLEGPVGVRAALEFAGSPLAVVLAGQLWGALHGAAAMRVQDQLVERWELDLIAASLAGCLTRPA